MPVEEPMTEPTMLQTVAKAQAAVATEDQIAGEKAVAKVLFVRTKALAITDEATRAGAVDLRAECKRASDKAEAARIALTKPLNDHVRFINAGFKPVLDLYASCIKQIDRLILADREAQRVAAEAEAVHAAAMAAAQEEADRVQLEAEMKAALEAAGVTAEEAVVVPEPEPAPLVPAPVAEIPRQVRGTSDASLITKKTWTYTVADITLVPRNFLVLDPGAVRGAIRDAAKAGKTDAEMAALIPGLSVFQTEHLSE
jgi:hypothetical protein